MDDILKRFVELYKDEGVDKIFEEYRKDAYNRVVKAQEKGLYIQLYIFEESTKRIISEVLNGTYVEPEIPDIPEPQEKSTII